MVNKLKAIEEKYIELENAMQQPEVYSDPAVYAKYAKEQKEIAPVVEAFRQYQKYISDMEGAKELLSDPDFREMAAGVYFDPAFLKV